MPRPIALPHEVMRSGAGGREGGGRNGSEPDARLGGRTSKPSQPPLRARRARRLEIGHSELQRWIVWARIVNGSAPSNACPRGRRRSSSGAKCGGRRSAHVARCSLHDAVGSNAAGMLSSTRWQRAHRRNSIVARARASRSGRHRPAWCARLTQESSRPGRGARWSSTWPPVAIAAGVRIARMIVVERISHRGDVRIAGCRPDRDNEASAGW